jgi:hypothetical protein
MKRYLVAVAMVAAAVGSAPAQDGWRPLFNGKTLDGWAQINGTAPYTVADGAIVGTTVVKSPNSFLATKEEFGDFILEYEARLDAPMNSGVQIRGLSTPSYQNGRVHGYQIEIDPSDRAWTGGLYDEARQGWLHPVYGPDAARRAFKMGQWNTFRVEAIGTSIRSWVNGVPVANVVDSQTARGFIALQVHSVGDDPARAGQTVRFRNLRIMTQNLQKYQTPDKGDTPQFNYVPNTLTDREKRDGWKLLWDGATTAGWRGAKLKAFPEKGWTIKDGALIVAETGGGEAAAGGDIVTTDEFENFELLVEFKLTKGANSGIKYFVDTELNQGTGSSIGCEFQLLDDAVHPDAKMGVKGNRTLAGLYDMIPPVGVRSNPIGEWNRARIVVQGRHVEHWLNGFKTVEYERGTQMWRALVNYSKYTVWPGFGERAKGHLLLQDHGNTVSFRSIKLRQLPTGGIAK